jgi:hypothetical protein
LRLMTALIARLAFIALLAGGGGGIRSSGHLFQPGGSWPAGFE